MSSPEDFPLLLFVIANSASGLTFIVMFFAPIWPSNNLASYLVRLFVGFCGVGHTGHVMAEYFVNHRAVAVPWDFGTAIVAVSAAILIITQGYVIRVEKR